MTDPEDPSQINPHILNSELSYGKLQIKSFFNIALFY
jgi:hypothetical protein